jgi:DNA polymerase-3 subunit delta'
MVVLEPTNQNILIPLETVRNHLRRLQMTASGTGFRVCLIDSVDNLNVAGMNALLKILEEPPPHTLFLIITHRPHRVLPTIRSRCWRLTLRPLSSCALQTLRASGGLSSSSTSKDHKRGVELLDSLKLLIDSNQAISHAQCIQTISALTTKDFILGGIGDTLETWIMDTFRAEIVSYSGTTPPAVLAKLEQRVELWQKTQAALKQICAVHGDPRPSLLTFFETWRLEV